MSAEPDLTCAKVWELGSERGDSSGEGIMKCETLAHGPKQLPDSSSFAPRKNVLSRSERRLLFRPTSLEGLEAWTGLALT